MYVEHKVGVSVWLIFITSICFITSHEAAVFCPNVSISYGDSSAVTCDSDQVITDFYWYRRQSSTPILILDKAGRGGSEYRSEHFDILPNGSMVVRDVNLEHESYYSFVGYYENGQFGSATFLVSVTISPDPPCPVVRGYSSCNQVDVLYPKNTGVLTCEINGSRPLLPLNWYITSQTGLNFVQNHPIEQRNKELDSWNITVSLHYTITDPCAVSGEVKCVAEDSFHILDSTESTVRIRKTGSCNSPVQSTSHLSIVIPLVVFLVVLTFVIVVAIFILCRRRTVLRGGLIETVHFMIRKNSAKVALLVPCLKRAYDKYCKLTPIPWDNIYIPVADLYTECECEVFRETVSTINLIKDSKIIQQKHVVIIGEHGHGRTSFAKYVVHQWIEDSLSTCLLIYVPLREVTKNTTLAGFIKRDLPEATTLDFSDIEELVTCRRIRCLVILDGYEDLSKSCDEHANNAMEEEDYVTIGELLEGNLKLQSLNIRVWVTSREVDYQSSMLKSPNHTLVKITGFSEKQLFKYIKRCCVYYCKNYHSSGCEINDKTNLLEDREDDAVAVYSSGVPSSTARECEIVTTRSEQPDISSTIYQKVVEFVKQNELFDEFKRTFLLLNITVHVLIGNYTSSISYLRDKRIPNLSALMRVVIDCMEKRYDQKNKQSKQDFGYLEQKLGKCAFRKGDQLLIMKQEDWESQIGKEELNTSLDIGLLKLSKRTTAATTDHEDWANPSSDIEFYHSHIQAYFEARYVLADTDRFATTLQNLTQYPESESCKFLIFIAGLVQSQQFRQLCAALQKDQKYNILIDCLLEYGGYELLPNILGHLANVHVKNLKSVYHRKAISTFCNKCKESKVELDSLSFETDVFLTEFFPQLHLPKVNIVEFPQMTSSKSNFDEICRWFSKEEAKASFRFKKRKPPTKIRKVFEDVFRERLGTEDATTPTFHYSEVTRRWEPESSGTAVLKLNDAHL